MNNTKSVFSGTFERVGKDVKLLSGRPIRILETSGKEEQILSKLGDKKAVGVMEDYLTAVTENLDGNAGKSPKTEFTKMLTGDRMYILLQNRLLTHGNIVNYKLTCPKCQYKSEHEVDIDPVIEAAVPYPHGDQREFSVKVDEGEIFFELSSGATEDKIAKNKNPDILSKLACMRMWEVLQDGSTIPVHFEDLRSKHIAAIRKRLKELECQLDTSALLTCTKCEEVSAIDVVVNPDFLFPNSM